MYVVDGNAGDGRPFEHIHCTQSAVIVITVKVSSLSLVVVVVAAACDIRQVDAIGLVGDDENKRSERQEGAGTHSPRPEQSPDRLDPS